MVRRIAQIVSVVSVGALLGIAAQAQTRFQFVHVDDFLTNYSLGECYIYDINDQNLACGTATAAFPLPGGSISITYTGFTWSEETDKSMAQVSWPRGLNNSAWIAGVSGLFDGASGQFTNVPVLPGTYAPVVLLDVNDSGVAVGYVQTCNCSNSQGTLQIPYVWDANGGARTLPVPGAKGASEITNSGLVIGWLGGNFMTDGFVFDLADGSYTLASSLFAGPNTQTTVTDINEFGVVTGWRLSNNGAQSTGFTWSTTTGLTLLPMPPQGYQPHVRPSGINNDGTVIGTIYRTDATAVPFVYDATHGLRELQSITTPAPGFNLMSATAINNNGWIVGFGSGGGFGFYTAFVLKPIVLGDVNGDGRVDESDLGALLGAFGNCSGAPGYLPAADFDNNGCNDESDLGVLLAAWAG